MVDGEELTYSVTLKFEKEMRMLMIFVKFKMK